MVESINQEIKFNKFTNILYNKLIKLDEKFSDDVEKTKEIAKEFSKYLIQNDAWLPNIPFLDVLESKIIKYGPNLEDYNLLLSAASNLVTEDWREIPSVLHPLVIPLINAFAYLDILGDTSAAKELTGYLKSIYGSNMPNIHLIDSAIEVIKEESQGDGRQVQSLLIEYLEKNPMYNSEDDDSTRILVTDHLLENMDNDYKIHLLQKKPDICSDPLELAKKLGIDVSDKSLKGENRYCPLTKRPLKDGEIFDSSVYE
ncbi:MAG: hypothetical protein GOU98_00340 [Candidatus Altiarchaeota archaeon]|nr:hypothetical protein [Candidatus Altiarchaeota archaeon]